MKKWLLIAVSILIIAACGDDKTTSSPTISKVDAVNDDVQSLVDLTEDDKFASIIYSETGTSYLLLNAPGKVKVAVESTDEILNVEITQEDDGSPEAIEDIVYSLELDKPYDTIHIFENGEEIPFEVWYE